MRNAEQLEVVCDACQLVPLSVLSLDLEEPLGGWEAMLRGRGVEVLEDDLGRPAISREDARALIADRREREAKLAAERAKTAAARKPSPVRGGIPFPESADLATSAYEVMRHVDAEAEQSDPDRRLSPQEEFLIQRLGRPRKVEVKEAEK